MSFPISSPEPHGSVARSRASPHFGGFSRLSRGSSGLRRGQCALRPRRAVDHGASAQCSRLDLHGFEGAGIDGVAVAVCTALIKQPGPGCGNRAFRRFQRGEIAHPKRGADRDPEKGEGLGGGHDEFLLGDGSGESGEKGLGGFAGLTAVHGSDRVAGQSLEIPDDIDAVTLAVHPSNGGIAVLILQLDPSQAALDEHFGGLRDLGDLKGLHFYLPVAGQHRAVHVCNVRRQCEERKGFLYGCIVKLEAA